MKWLRVILAVEGERCSYWAESFAENATRKRELDVW